ncbi:uncharacterized protein si:dkey-187a12.4 isoform X1 [Electrophorus electricus]|uniref:uncharacterized protein si:dkey-187a12.4 isoform X1 n=1 Tax=Electrophorus electricus TaxID=8005 RepID=UPI000F0A754E|nr:uncharacterized protein si:dkey-187a12.4 isoform X1 [Electrophorus electricus]
MEPNNGNGPNWAMQRRVEGLVNKHMADMALETLQQRLSAVSEEMNHLSDDISRREDIPKRGEDIPRRTNVNFSAEPLSDSYSAGIVGEKLMPDTSSESAAQRKIISLLLEIKEEQQRQWAVLKDLQARVQGQMCEEEVESLDMDLPLRTMEQLDETERHLEDAAAQKRMVSHLSRMGGATVDDAVRRLMQAVLSFSVGSELNWVGRGQKRSFRNTRLQGVLFRALKRTPVGKEATHHQFADVVKKWLRFAPFRQGGSGRRQHYKPSVEYMCPKFHTDTEG